MIWVFLGWKLKILLSYLKSAPSKKSKIPKFGTKNTLFGCLWARTFKNSSHVWNQHPSICLIAKFGKKTPKMPKFETKNALFGYFLAGILKTYCHTWNQHPWICLIAKFHKKTTRKCLNLRPKMPYLGIVGVDF